mgnify:FL=1
MINIQKDKNGLIIVIFLYNPQFVQKIKTVYEYNTTVKAYMYYNSDLLIFAHKSPSDINESDIKDYLFYLAEEKQFATSTINQAINALKFYYGIILKKKFLYEIKRPRKDKKLPIVLSKEEVGCILLNTRQY